MEGLKRWLDANPVARWALARVTLLALGLLLGAIGALGLLPPDVVAQLQAVLG